LLYSWTLRVLLGHQSRPPPDTDQSGERIESIAQEADRKGWTLPVGE
jgi:hypothetical protein